MANYLKDDIICQTYIHFDLPMPDEEDLGLLQDSLSSFIDTRSNFLLRQNVETKVEVKDGSIIQYLTVLGSLYVLISQYPKFREGVIAIYNDIKLLTEGATLEAQYVTRAPTSSIVHSEARMGLIGILKGILDRLQNIDSSSGLVRISTLTKRLRMCELDTVKIIETLSDTKDVRYVAENVRDLVFELPSNPPQRKNLKNPEPHEPGEYRAALKSLLAVLEDASSTASQNSTEGEQDVPPKSDRAGG